jgi:triacylglycerol lipase
MARRVGAWLRETRAFLTQARYLPQDLRPSHHAGSGPTVIFLHGLYASAGVWRPLRNRMEAELDVTSYSISYVPGPSVEEMTDSIAALVGKIEEPRSIHLIGHSFGGLAVRNYASRATCDSRVVDTISLAAPFLGSLKTAWVPGQGGRDLLPNSEILARLRENSHENVRVPHLSVCGGEDQLIVGGAFPDYGEHLLIPRVGHNGLLFHEQTIERVLLRVEQFSKREKAHFLESER